MRHVVFNLINSFLPESSVTMLVVSYFLGEKVDIEQVSDLYNYKERVLNVVKEYLDME